jgi:tetratricopeptide (TPR) repeat protein
MYKFYKIIIVLIFTFPLHVFANCAPPNNKEAIWKDCDLTGYNLTGKTIVGQRMENIIFNDAILDNVTLDFHYMIDSQFNRSSLRNAKIIFSDAESIEFSDADMRGSKITGYRFAFTSFNKANLEGASINVSRIRGGVNYSGANLSGASFGSKICALGSKGSCSVINKFSLNYDENKSWPSKEIKEHSSCVNEGVDESHYSVINTVDLDSDGVCDSLVRTLGNHATYPEEYSYHKYGMPHGDEITKIKYYSPYNGKHLQVEMEDRNGMRVLYRNIDGIYQIYRIDHFSPDLKNNIFVYKESKFPLKDSKETNSRGEAQYHKGNIIKAIKYYKDAIKTNKYNYQAVNNLSLANYRLKKYDDSTYRLNELAHSKASNTQRAAAFYNMARAHEKLNNLREAHENYLSAYEVKPRKVYKEKAESLETKLELNFKVQH